MKTQTPGNKYKEKRFKLVSILLSKMFYGHTMFIGGNSQKGSRYLSFPPGLSLSHLVDTKSDFNLNNIIATLSLISISSVKKICRQISWHVLKLDLNSAPYNRNVTLQTLQLFSAYAQLYNAAPSPASRLRSAVSLALNWGRNDSQVKSPLEFCGVVFQLLFGLIIIFYYSIFFSIVFH